MNATEIWKIPASTDVRRQRPSESLNDEYLSLHVVSDLSIDESHHMPHSMSAIPREDLGFQNWRFLFLHELAHQTEPTELRDIELLRSGCILWSIPETYPHRGASLARFGRSVVAQAATVQTRTITAAYVRRSESSEPQFRTFYNRCKKRLQHLETLKDGWLDGAGRAPTALALRSARQFLRRFAEHSELFSIFPTENGGVLFEFSCGEWAYSVEFSAGGLVMFYGIEIAGEGEILPPPRFQALREPLLSRIGACMMEESA